MDRDLLEAPLDDLLAEARAVRDRHHGNRITYSPKVFIPLTMLCRDRCGYCTFAQPPARLESPYLTPEEVLAIARAGARRGCHEALFTLGERPELRYPAAADWLAEHGYASTVELLLDGEKTVPLSEEATGGRIAAMKVDDAVCWQVARPLPTKLRVSAKGGGLVPTYVGDSLEKIGVNAWAVGGPAKGSGDARELDDVELVPEGGSWALKSESPLKAGEYVLVFRVFGSNNWDRQAVLVTLDPKLPSSASGKPAK